MRSEAKFKIAGWEEKPFAEDASGESGKLTRASVRKTYSGGLSGEGVVEYVMAYGPDGSAEYVGYERVTGRLEGMSGSFVWRHTGTYAQDRMVQTSTIVEGSGTGELAGISGRAEILAGHQKDYPFTLEYEMALAELQKNGVVQLDEERKAQMVGNLLVVLCGERATQPIVNAGTLY